ncbi:Hint domain-containing protein [Litoreibacter albidus]|uniref:Hint domain-containing protein n=1 Tax=Litoreibacter albidus TaxID=670155 RepID=UPI0037361C11
MATHDVKFYAIDPLNIFSSTPGNTRTYTGPAEPDAKATITDNQTGAGSETFEDIQSGESATIATTINGVSSSGDTVWADESWTLIDQVTGQSFQIVSIRINTGPNAGWYTLSEIPLVAGRSYQTADFDNTPSAAAGDPTFSYADYVSDAEDGVIQGTAGDDIIDKSYTGDPDGDQIDQGDVVTAAQFNWTDYADETDLRSAFSQDTGGITVGVTYSDPNPSDQLSAETTETIYVAGGEPFNSTSAGYMFAGGAAEDTTLTFDFSANGGSGLENEVQNVRFRISDIDGIAPDGVNDFQDIVRVQAFDADGNPVDVTITGGSNHTVDPATGTITAGLTNYSPASAQASALIEIAGPVSQVVVTYDNGGTTQQAIYFSDVHFDAVDVGGYDDVVEAGAGDDIITAGTGDDTVYGGAGNDTINTGTGDTSYGQAGNDTFVIDTENIGGGTLFVDGGSEGATDVDTLNFNGQLQYGSLVKNADPNDSGAFSGSATLLDGTVVTFDNIENVLCFTDGMALDTPHGPRLVEDLKPGDLVLTRDNGPQPVRWHGRRDLVAAPSVAPIEIAAGLLGNVRPIRVSPQHRILCAGYRAQLYFGHDEVLVAAKSLVNGSSVRQLDAGAVSYHHILFDQHEIVTCDGVASESYHPGSYSLPGLDNRAREELFGLFPELRADPSSFGPSARFSVKASQGHLLAA